MARMSSRPSARRRTIDARLGLTRRDAPSGPTETLSMPRVVGVLIAIMVGVAVM